MLDGALGHGMRRDDGLRGTQHVIVKRFELRMPPQTACVAARHTNHMWDACHLRREISRNPIWLQIVREYDIESMRRMGGRSYGGKLRDKGARHRNVGRRAVHRIRPVHGYGACAVARLT